MVLFHRNSVLLSAFFFFFFHKSSFFCWREKIKLKKGLLELTYVDFRSFPYWNMLRGGDVSWSSFVFQGNPLASCNRIGLFIRILIDGSASHARIERSGSVPLNCHHFTPVLVFSVNESPQSFSLCFPNQSSYGGTCYSSVI